MNPTRAEAAESLWEEFARRDPQFYIDPSLGPGVGLGEFRRQGRGPVDGALAWAGERGPGERALEIGSGLGRNTVHLAEHFARVDGVDVSATMVRVAAEHGLPENVRLHVVSGRDLDGIGNGCIDVVFSHLVFQHIEAGADIEGYLRESARVLRVGGIALLQFDTRPVTALARLARHVPDRLLPRDRRSGIRRHRRAAAWVRERGAAAGLALERERNPDSADHWFLWRR